MREIKFRAWNKVGNKMGPSENLVSWILGACTVAEKSLNKDWSASIFMQYTGLKDRNGVEIYEGDILKGGYVVQWSETGFCYEAKMVGYGAAPLYYFQKEDEVIGNIYENPELLEVKR